MPWRQTEGWIDLARTQVLQGNSRAALQTLERVLGTEPDHAQAHAWMALALVDEERIVEASRAAGNAVALEADAPFHHTVLAYVALARQDLSSAEVGFRQAIDLDPESPEAYTGMARLCHLRNRPRDALAWTAKARESDPEDVTAIALEGEIRLDRGDVTAARQMGELGLGIDPEHHAALLLMAKVLARRGEAEAARDHAVLALMKSPEDQEAIEVLVELKARRNLLFLLWWRCEQAMRRFGPISRTVVVISLLIGYAIGSDMLVARGLLEWKYGLSAVVFPLGIYLVVSYFALDWMIEREKREIALETSF